MRVTVCELANDPDEFIADWKKLVSHSQRERSELVLLPEMTFYQRSFAKRNFDGQIWNSAVESHERWIKWAVVDVRKVDELDTKLRRVNNSLVFGLKYLPTKYRLLFGLACIIPSARNMIRLLRYEF